MLFVSVERIEKKLQEMFPTGYPVLCSSGRAALFMALSESNVTRSNAVGIFPYASHCVLDAVSRIATPLTGSTWISADLRVVYHQWGYVQETNLRANTIEDCVDTLCVPGAQLFPGGGSFEIWSLNKILGTNSGGVLWCRDEETAIRIRCKRDKQGGGFIQWMLRLLTNTFPGLYDYWQGAESGYRNLSIWQTGEIFSALGKWDELIADRKNKMELVQDMIVAWLPKPTTRFPTVVAVLSEMQEEDLADLGIEHGYRMIERINSDGSRILTRVLPIPIHHDISIETLIRLMKAIK
jgi:putative PLP-dependent aminotransferase (TIGR04422 family)